MRSLFTFIILLSVAACGSAVKYQSVGPEDFSGMLKKSDGATLLDVRTEEEVISGAIPGSINIDFYREDFEKAISTFDKQKTIFVYCAKGGRSRQAVDLLKRMNFREIIELKGGYDAWAAKGLSTTK